MMRHQNNVFNHVYLLNFYNMVLVPLAILVAKLVTDQLMLIVKNVLVVNSFNKISTGNIFLLLDFYSKIYLFVLIFSANNGILKGKCM